jgi:hypothetical protein
VRSPDKSKYDDTACTNYCILTERTALLFAARIIRIQVEMRILLISSEGDALRKMEAKMGNYKQKHVNGAPVTAELKAKDMANSKKRDANSHPG